MPYIPPKNRPEIDQCVDELASQIAGMLQAKGETAEISTRYREAFLAVAEFIAQREGGQNPPCAAAAAKLAQMILTKAAGYNTQGAWTGELNYALTRLIQKVPLAMVRKGAWTEPMRYWIYAETVGALTRTAYDVHGRYGNDYIGNGLAGVFEDVKDEYKRRVNTAYEAVQILKSGDCFDLVPYRTALVPVKVGSVEGYQEVMLPVQQVAK